MPFRKSHRKTNTPLQTPHVWKSNVDDSHRGRASRCTSLRGSITMETMLVLPFMVCAIAALLYLFAFSGANARAYRSLVEQAEALAVTTGQSSTDDPYIYLTDLETVSTPFSAFSFGSSTVQRKVTVRCWAGYTGESFSDGSTGQMVYRTPDGSVYHLSSDCSYLKLSIQSISSDELDSARNSSGGKYAACEYCVKNGSANALVYITNYGSSYHNSSGCQGLKRTILAVPLSEVGDLSCCSRCGK